MATQNKDIVENIYEEYVKRMNLIKSDFRQETFKNILNQYLVIDRKVVDDLMKDILYMKAWDTHKWQIDFINEILSKLQDLLPKEDNRWQPNQ